MIWQSFVDETILGTSQVAKAAIHGLDGTRYAASTGFVVRYYFIIELLFC
jgi:profilin